MNRSVYDGLAAQCFQRFIDRIIDQGAQVYESDILDMISLQLTGQRSWNEEARKRMRRHLDLDPQVITPIIDATFADLEAAERSVSEKGDDRAGREIRASLLVLITQDQLDRLREKISLRLGGTLAVLGVVATGGLLYTAVRVLSHYRGS